MERSVRPGEKPETAEIKAARKRGEVKPFTGTADDFR